MLQTLFDPRVLSGLGVAMLGRATMETALACPARLHEPGAAPSQSRKPQRRILECSYFVTGVFLCQTVWDLRSAKLCNTL